MTTRFERLYRARVEQGKFVCVGLDPDIAQLPGGIGSTGVSAKVERFLMGIIDATHQVAAAYKPQSSYYEALGSDGMRVLENICNYIRSVDPEIPIILDYKRGDIGRTSQAYVSAAYDVYGVDAVTANPYMGKEAMQPFLDHKDGYTFVLCRTSNPGAGEFQELLCYPFVDSETGLLYSSLEEAQREGITGKFEQATGTYLYEFMAHRVARSWSHSGNCGLVVGATAPQELGVVRRIVGGDMIILVPGIGTQGGDLAASIENGRGTNWLAEVFNNSSAILYAYKKPGADGRPYGPGEWTFAASDAAEKMNAQIAALVR